MVVRSPSAKTSDLSLSEQQKPYKEKFEAICGFPEEQKTSVGGGHRFGGGFVRKAVLTRQLSQTCGMEGARAAHKGLRRFADAKKKGNR